MTPIVLELRQILDRIQRLERRVEQDDKLLTVLARTQAELDAELAGAIGAYGAA